MSDVSEWWFGWNERWTPIRLMWELLDQMEKATGVMATNTLPEIVKAWEIAEQQSLEIDDDLREWFEIAMGEDGEDEEE